MSPENLNTSPSDECAALVDQIQASQDREALYGDGLFEEKVYEFVFDQFIDLRDHTPGFEFDQSLAILAVDYLLPFERDDLPHFISPWHILRSLKPYLN